MIKPSRPLTKDEVLDSLHTMLGCGPRHVLIPRVAQEEGNKGEVQVFIRDATGQHWQIDLKKVDAAKRQPPAGRTPLRHRREDAKEYDG